MPAPNVACTASAFDASSCRVDLATYLGHRVFAEYCSTCHAIDGLGSSFAPNLIERIAAMEKRRFLLLMERGYLGAAEPAVPAWGENPYVGRYYEELWTYLRARASGALPPGSPVLAEEGADTPPP
jgi:mono/diheme cytochrome c family protein